MLFYSKTKGPPQGSNGTTSKGKDVSVGAVVSAGRRARGIFFHAHLSNAEVINNGVHSTNVVLLK